MLLVVAVVGLIAALLVFPFENLENWAWDFAVFRAGSKALIHGHNPYEPANVVRFSDGAELASIPNYVYAPFFAILISPLSFLEPWLASRAWFLINLISCVAAVAATMAALRWIPRPREFVLIVIGLAAFPPLRTLVVIGQSGGIMLLLLSLSFLFLRKDRPVLAGVLLGLALFKPHLVLVPLYLALRRQWKTVLAVAVTVLMASLPFWNLLDDWAISLISTRADNLGYGCIAFSSLAAWLQCFTDSLIAQVVLVISLIALGFWLIRENAPPQSMAFAAQLSLVIALSLLVIDNVRVADLILLSFPFAICVNALRTVEVRRQRRLVIGLLLAAYLFPYFSQVFGWLTRQPLLFDMPIWYAAMSTGLLAALVLLIRSGQPDVDASD